jgi:hypothetical protein
MNHGLHRVTAFELVGPYILALEFDDGTRRTINFEAVLEGEIYGPLRDSRLFAQVDLDPEVHTIVWPNGADFDPETLHDWPKYEIELIEMGKRWSSVRAHA